MGTEAKMSDLSFKLSFSTTLWSGRVPPRRGPNLVSFR
jgi:hypothetical protein